MRGDGQRNAGETRNRGAPTGSRIYHDTGFDVAARGADPSDPAVGAFDAGNFSPRVNLRSQSVSTAGVAPHHGIMPDIPPGGMIEAPHNGIARTWSNVEGGYHLFDFTRIHHAAIYTEYSIRLRAYSQSHKGGIRVCKRYVSLLGEEQVVIQFPGKPFPHPDAFVVKRNALGGSVVGT